MAEFEDTLNHILGDENAMGQIMALAQSLSGEQKQEQPQQPQNSPSASQPDFGAMLGGIDPNLIKTGMELLQGTQGQNQRTASLAEALKPFLREDRRGKLDRAVQIAGVIRLARAAFRTAQERGEHHV